MEYGGCFSAPGFTLSRPVVLSDGAFANRAILPVGTAVVFSTVHFQLVRSGNTNDETNRKATCLSAVRPDSEGISRP